MKLMSLLFIHVKALQSFLVNKEKFYIYSVLLTKSIVCIIEVSQMC